MVALRTWLRPGAAILILAGILGLGCGGKNNEPAGYSLVEGTVSFTRLPVLYDASTGAPTGLGTTGTVVAARGVVVKVFQRFDDVDTTGTVTPAWRLMGTTFTDSVGAYSLSGVAKTGYPTLVELDSVYQQDSGDAAQVKVVAEPGGIRSATSEPNRPIYVVRKDPAGNVFTVTDPLGSSVTPAILSGSTRVDFPLTNGTGDIDTWAVTVPDWYASGSAPVHQTDTKALGSRVLNILDTAWLFAYYYGDPTPAKTKNGVLDLHYYPGVTESPRRSYVVYDPTLLASRAFDGTTLHYFGTIAGGPVIDDAWDGGVLYPLYARGHLAGLGKSGLYPYGQDDAHADLAPSMAPDLALVEGLGDAMAATLLKTPFLTDLSATSALVGRDIRTVGTQGIRSPANLAALAWRLVLTVNGVETWDAGTPLVWAGIDPTYTARFFALAYPTEERVTRLTGTVTLRKDVASILGQLQVLYENHTEDARNLSRYFNDLNLIPICSTFGIDWPGTGAWSPLAANWGTDPSGAMPSVSLTLDSSAARRVPDPNVGLASPGYVYLNDSGGEVAYARLDLTLGCSYRVSLTTTPAVLPTGAQVELVLDDQVDEPILFDAADATAKTWTLAGSPNDTSNPARHWVRIRLLSQDPSLSATPIGVVVNLTPVS
jgi:hypothetical protein